MTTPGPRTAVDPIDAFHLYDTTLRDGSQQEGLTLSVADKLAVARHLDELGVTDVAVVGLGPAGRALAYRCLARGLFLQAQDIGGEQQPSREGAA